MRYVMVLLLLAGASTAAAESLEKFNSRLAGRVIDFTRNHGEDNRLYSKILNEKRDLYIYLPPGYDPANVYPFVLWYHGAFGDEHSFFHTPQLEYLDQCIQVGTVPPVVIACPDGTYGGSDWILETHSFYVNGKGGRFKDHVLQEVIPYVLSHYSIRPEKQAHAIVGISGGGFGAMNLAITHRNYFSSVATLSSPLNVRQDNLDGDYLADFHPQRYRWKVKYDPREIIGKFFWGAVRLPARAFISPIFGEDEKVLERAKRDNPADLLFSSGIKPGELNMLIAYGDQDELNLDAHSASFIWMARHYCGIPVYEYRVAGGRHDSDFFHPQVRVVWHWLARYLPPAVPRERLPAEIVVERTPSRAAQVGRALRPRNLVR